MKKSREKPEKKAMPVKKPKQMKRMLVVIGNDGERYRFSTFCTMRKLNYCTTIQRVHRVIKQEYGGVLPEFVEIPESHPILLSRRDYFEWKENEKEHAIS